MATNRSIDQADVQQAIECLSDSSLLHRLHYLLQNTGLRHSSTVSLPLCKSSLNRHSSILSRRLSVQIHSVTSDNERDYEMITNIQQKLIFDKITPSKSTGEILHLLMQELNQLKAELTGECRFGLAWELRLLETYRFSAHLYDSVAVSMTAAREMSRTGSASGKKKIILSRVARRRKREDIPLVRLSSSGLFFRTTCVSQRACLTLPHDSSLYRLNLRIELTILSLSDVPN